MTVWYKSYFFITLISPWICHCPLLFFTENSIPESAMIFFRHIFFTTFSVKNSLPKPNSWVRHEFFSYIFFTTFSVKNSLTNPIPESAMNFLT